MNPKIPSKLKYLNHHNFFRNPNVRRINPKFPRSIDHILSNKYSKLSIELKNLIFIIDASQERTCQI